MAPPHDWDSIQHIADEPLYCSAPQQPEDIILEGSDTEETPAQTRIKRLRYEEAAQSYLDGKVPFLQSASLRGPFGRESGWVNPWRHKHRPRPTWWEPQSEDMLFTRPNVLQWARDCGLGHLNPVEALARCRAQAKSERETMEEMEREATKDLDPIIHGTLRCNRVNSSLIQSVERQSSDEQEDDDLEEDSRQQWDKTDQDPKTSTTFHLSQKNNATSFMFSTDSRERVDSNLLPGNATRGLKRQADSQWLKTKRTKHSKWEDTATNSTPTPIHKVPTTGHERRRGSSKPGQSNTDHRVDLNLVIEDNSFSMETSNAISKLQRNSHVHNPSDLQGGDPGSKAGVEYTPTLPIGHPQKSKSGQKRKRVPGLEAAQAIWESLQPKHSRQQGQTHRRKSDTSRTSQNLTSGIINSNNMHTSSQISPGKPPSNMDEKRAYLFHDPVVIDLESDDDNERLNLASTEKKATRSSSSDRRSKYQKGKELSRDEMLKTPGPYASQSSFVTEVAPSTRGLGTFHFRKKRKPIADHTVISVEDSAQRDISVSSSLRNQDSVGQYQISPLESPRLPFQVRQASLSHNRNSHLDMASFSPLESSTLKLKERSSKGKNQTQKGGLESTPLENISQTVHSYLKGLPDFTCPANEEFQTPIATPKIPTPKLPTPFGFETSFGVGMFDGSSSKIHATAESQAPVSDIPSSAPPLSYAKESSIPKVTTSARLPSIQQTSRKSTPSKSVSRHPNTEKSWSRRQSQSSASDNHDHNHVIIETEKRKASVEAASSPETSISLVVPLTKPTSPEKATKSKIISPNEDGPVSDQSSDSWEIVEGKAQTLATSSPVAVHKVQTYDPSTEQVGEVEDKTSVTPIFHRQPDSSQVPSANPRSPQLAPRLPLMRVYVSGKVLVSSPVPTAPPSKSQKSPQRTKRLPRDKDKLREVDPPDFSTQSYDSAYATSPVRGSPYRRRSLTHIEEVGKMTKDGNIRSPSRNRRTTTKSVGATASSPELEGRLGLVHGLVNGNSSSVSKATHVNKTSPAASKSRNSTSMVAQSPFQRPTVSENHNAGGSSSKSGLAGSEIQQDIEHEPIDGEGPQSPWMDEDDENILTVIPPANLSVPLNASSIQAEESFGQDDEVDHGWQQIDSSAILEGGLSTSFGISTPVSKSQEQEKIASGTSSLHATQLLYEESNNPWKSNLKTPRSRKSKKRVSFGILPANEAEDSQLDLLPRLRSKSPPPAKELQIEDSYIDADEENDHVTRDNTVANRVKMPTTKYQPAVSGNKYRVTGSPYKRSSPPVDAMAEAFIEADHEGSSEGLSGLKESLDSNQHLTPKTGVKAHHNRWNFDAESDVMESFSISPSGKLKKTTSQDENLDDMIDDVGAFLDGWSVEADLQKANEANSSRNDRKRPSSKRERYSGFSNVWS